MPAKDKEAVTQEIQKSAPTHRPEDIIRDPYVLEFLGFSDDAAFRESDLEQALITHLQKFLLELGRGFAFGRAKSASPLMGAISILTLFFTTI